MLFKSSLKTIIIGLGGIGLDYDLKKRDRIFSHAKSVSKSKNFDLIAGMNGLICGYVSICSCCHNV